MKLIFTKFFTVLFMVAILLYIIDFAWVNYNTTNNIVSINIPLFITEPITTTISTVILFSAFLGGCIGILYTLKINSQCDNAIEYYKNKYAQATMGSDENSALVENLQRKIASLEIALEQALNKNN